MAITGEIGKEGERVRTRSASARAKENIETTAEDQEEEKVELTTGDRSSVESEH